MTINVRDIEDYLTARAGFDCLAARFGIEKAEIDKRQAEVWLTLAKNRARPSLSLFAQVAKRNRDDGSTYYVASACGLEVEGSTPEIAFDNFDHEWTQGQ